MFMMNWPTAIITFACLFGLYLVVAYRKPGEMSFLVGRIQWFFFQNDQAITTEHCVEGYD